MNNFGRWSDKQFDNTCEEHEVKYNSKNLSFFSRLHHRVKNRDNGLGVNISTLADYVAKH